MERSDSHVIDTKTKDFVRSLVDNYYENGDALFREISERDYGIDALLELFENTNPTGMLALLQIKGTEKTIEHLKNTNAVSCSISVSNFKYALQKNIPVILIYATLCNTPGFYYARIQDAVTENSLLKANNQNSITIRIPATNNSYDNFEGLFGLIKEYYLKR